MNAPQTHGLLEPFAILTPRLVLLPTPIAVSLATYRAHYAGLHSDVGFCEMAFGHHLPPRNWSDSETREVIETRDIEVSWKRYGLGDFAVGLREIPDDNIAQEDPSSSSVLKGDKFEHLAGPNSESLNEIKWVGYAGVRDATITSLPSREAEDPVLPPWYEMVELRYGLSPDFWGGGIAKEASEAIMQWSVKERGVKRFIAETERDNQRSARLLQKLGFVSSGTDYWKEPSEVEWEMVVQ